MPRRPCLSPAQELAAQMRRWRRRYRRRLERCQEQFTEPAVHELRIETRRLLALLELLREFQLGDGLKKLRRLFKQRLDAFDPLRDTHVQLQLLKPLWRRFPEARDLERWLRRREKKFTARLRRNVRRARQRQLERRLKEVERQLRAAALDMSTVTSALRAAFAEVLVRRRAIRRSQPATIHRLRIAFKRFRYTCELLQPVLPTLDRTHLRAMRKLQRLLGDIQDHEVLLETLPRAAAEMSLAPAEFAGLRRHLRDRRRSLIDTFLANADALDEFQPASE